MKSIVKIVTIAAVLATVAPAYAMFNRLGSTFLSKRYTPMYLNRKPLITLGALLGTAAITAAKKPAKAVYDPEYCSKQLALYTLFTIQAKNNNDSQGQNLWLKDRYLVFNKCEKEVASRDEIYNRNIAYALYQAEDKYTRAKDSLVNQVYWYQLGHDYTAVAEQLKKEQAEERNK